MKTNESEYKRLDDQLLSLMTRVHAFLKGRLTLGELGAAEERAEIFRTNQVTNYDEVAERVNEAQIEQENAELLKDKERLDWLLSKGLAWNGCYKGDWREGEWMYGNSTFNSDARNDIDKAMEEAQ